MAESTREAAYRKCTGIEADNKEFGYWRLDFALILGCNVCLKGMALIVDSNELSPSRAYTVC